MAIQLVDIEGLPVLGHSERMPDLLEWASKVGPNNRWIEDYAFGLRLKFSSGADENSVPKMYIYWNNAKFLQFISNLGKVDSIRFLSLGVEVYHIDGVLKVSLPNGVDGAITLWNSEDIGLCRELHQPKSDNNFYWLAGVVGFTDTGPYFYNQAECPEEVEKVSAVAVIRKDVKQIKLSDAPLPEEGKPTSNVHPHMDASILAKLTEALTKITTKGKRV